MAARSNGPRRRRHRPGTLPSCPASQSETLIGAGSSDRDAEKQRDRLRQRVLCRHHWLCADLAHLVDGSSGAVWCIRDSPCVRVSRPGGGRDIGGDNCSVRTTPPGGGCPMNVAVTLDDVPKETLASASEAGPAPKRIV